MEPRYLGSKFTDIQEITVEIVHESVYEQLIGQHGFDLEAPEIDEAFLNSTDDKVLDTRADCSWTTALITDKTENFVDWDVQVSAPGFLPLPGWHTIVNVCLLGR